jgi:uncharacterized OB-fold protein
MPDPLAPSPQSLVPPAALTAPHILEYPYTRSTGDVIGRFFASLKEHRLTGIRTPGGRTLCPPLEYDPPTGASLLDAEWVDLPDSGTVTTWTWIEHPRPKHPLQTPFAFALIKIDGADTALLHTVVAPTSEAISTGMRVRAHWREETTGDVTDIEYFIPEAG